MLRLFNKLRSLRILINALATSILPVFNAFLIVILIYVVYAILGVELFADRNPQRFGTFISSAWTVLQSFSMPVIVKYHRINLWFC